MSVKRAVRVVVSAAVVAALFVVSGSEAVARPKYKDAINAAYPDLAKKHGTDGKLTCAVCHPKNDKKIRNNYGKDFGKHLSKKNETDETKLKEALTATEKDKSATEGKTYGDLITAGELPGTMDEAK